MSRSEFVFTTMGFPQAFLPLLLKGDEGRGISEMGKPRSLIHSEGRGGDSIPKAEGKAREGIATWTDTPVSLRPAGRSHA